MIQGTEGVDNLNEVGGDDCIDALDGNDSINGHTGGEGAILGGAGNDQITVVGPRLVAGGPGDDNINTNGSKLQLFGQSGNDTFNVNDAPLAIAFAGSGNDRLNAANVDGGHISGGSGDDILNVVGNGVTVEGNSGDDVISATGNNQTINPGPGMDRVTIAGSATTVVVNDVCELLAGEEYVGGGPDSTLVLPIPLSEALLALGVEISNFGTIEV